MAKALLVLRALDAALKARLGKPLPGEQSLGFAAGPLVDWRGGLAKMLDDLESATSGDVVRLALLVPEDKVPEVRVFLAGIAAALDHRPARPASQAIKAEVPRDPTMSIDETETYLRVSRKVLRGLVQTGKLNPSRPTRKSWVFSKKELDNFLKATRR